MRWAGAVRASSLPASNDICGEPFCDEIDLEINNCDAVVDPVLPNEGSPEKFPKLRYGDA